MSDHHEELEKRGFRFVAVFIIALLSAYTLSVGPARALLYRDWETLLAYGDRYRTVYRPLHWLADRTETSGWLEDYKDAWGDWL